MAKRLPLQEVLNACHPEEGGWTDADVPPLRPSQVTPHPHARPDRFYMERLGPWVIAHVCQHWDSLCSLTPHLGRIFKCCLWGQDGTYKCGVGERTRALEPGSNPSSAVY